MSFHFQNRARNRFLKFGFRTDISGKVKIYNDEGNGFIFIIYFIILAIILLFNLKQGADKGIFLAVWGVMIIGALVKFILNRFLPQIIFDESGIKFHGHKKVDWDRIEQIRVSRKLSNTSIIIITDKGRNLLHFPKINPEKTRYLVRSYFQTNKK